MHSLAGFGCPVNLAALSQELPQSCMVRLTMNSTQVVGDMVVPLAAGEAANASVCNVSVLCVGDVLTSLSS